MSPLPSLGLALVTMLYAMLCLIDHDLAQAQILPYSLLCGALYGLHLYAAKEKGRHGR